MKNLFVTDLDGTFVKDSITVTKNALAACHKLKSYGDFSVATGRSVKEIEYIAESNDIAVKYMIGFNGAVVTEQSNVLFEKAIPKQQAIKIFQYLKENNLIFDALDGKKRIGNFKHEQEKKLWNMELICVENPFDLLMDKEIFKINVRPSATELATHYKNIKENFPEVEIYQSGATRMEITAKGISKASGIEEIKKDYDRVVVFGDSGNDVEMFRVADVSYCMDSAPEEVKGAATHIVENFENAVEHFIKMYY